MKFEHQKLIEDNEIDLADLPPDLKASIDLFNEKLEEYETAEDENDEIEIKDLKAELKKLSAEIASEIREFLEEEELSEEEEETISKQEEKLREEEPMPKDKEGILKYLFTKNIQKVTKEDLKKYGYPVGFWDSFPMKGETIGDFRLSRNTTDEPFEISKIN